MAKKERYPDGFHYTRPSIGSTAEPEPEPSGGSSDSGSSVPIIKSLSLNNHQFGIATQVVSLSKLSISERKLLVQRLTAELGRLRAFQKKLGTTTTTSTSLTGQKNRNNNNNKNNNNKSVMAMVKKKCETLLRSLINHEYGWVFKSPVDVVALNLPDYFTIIKHPMDLGTIRKKLSGARAGGYSSPHDFAADVRLTFANAMTYNPPGNHVHMMAQALSQLFEKGWSVIEKKIPAPVRREDEEEEEKEVVVPLSKKRKVSSLQDSEPVTPLPPVPPVQRVMSAEDMSRLSRELESLMGELPDNIIEFLKQHCSTGGADTAEDEIEIDLDVLSDDVLYKLRGMLDECLQGRERNQCKLAAAEPCEIELLHGSGLSNSSMQAGKGGEPVDEDVDIEGSEPPVTSFYSTEVKRDSDRSKCIDENAEHIQSESGKGKLPQLSQANQLLCSTDVLENDAGSARQLEDKQSMSALNQVGQSQQQASKSLDSNVPENGDNVPNESQVSSEQLYRAAVLKSRFADTILKAREKALSQGDNVDPEKLRLEREQLEMQKKREKARLLAEAKAAEDARRQSEAEEAKRKREMERAAARQALLQMEKTVEINENSRILEDLEKLRAATDVHIPSSVDELSPDLSHEALCGFGFGGSNPLEQLGLFRKDDDDVEEEEVDPLSTAQQNDVEEGEIDI